MRFFFLLPLCCLVFIACSGTENIVQEGTKKQGSPKTDIQSPSTHPSKDVCGMKSCALDVYLQKQQAEGNIDTEKAIFFQKRFGNLVLRYKKKDVLLKTPEFNEFVKDFYAEFFSCLSGECKEKKAYSYDEQNYIWYIFLPQMIHEEFVIKNGGSEEDAESIAQAVKERYFATYDEKTALIAVYKDKLRDKSQKINISKIDPKRLREDKAYFEQFILEPNTGLYDQFALEIPVSVIWPEKGQLQEIVRFTTDLFFTKLKELGIDRERFYAITGTSSDNFKRAEKKLLDMEKRYRLSEKIPNDRYLRHDEIVKYIFMNLPEFDMKGDFKKDTLELKHYILLQYGYPDDHLYSTPERISKFSSINSFMIENLYKYSKYMNDSNSL